MEDMNWKLKESFLEELIFEVSFERTVINKMFTHMCRGYGIRSSQAGETA